MNSPDRKDLFEGGLIWESDPIGRWTKLPTMLQNEHLLRVGAGLSLMVTILGISAMDDSARVPDKATAIFKGEQQAREDAIRREAIKIPELPLTTGEYLKITAALLSERGLNMIELSFRESMAQLGFQVGPLETFGTEAIRVKAGKDGHLRRIYPTTDLRFGDAMGQPITKGETFPVYAIIRVLDKKSRLIDVFGLTEPWRVTQIPDSLQHLARSPNIIGGKQYEPSWVRLGRVHSSGRIESFLDPQQNLDRIIGDRTAMVKTFILKFDTIKICRIHQ